MLLYLLFIIIGKAPIKSSNSINVLLISKLLDLHAATVMCTLYCVRLNRCNKVFMNGVLINQGYV
jgi:hypothetical protein